MGPIPRHLERVEAVARFRLTTGHSFLEEYLHWLGLAVDEACQLCGHFNALDSMNIRMNMLAVGTGRGQKIGVISISENLLIRGLVFMKAACRLKTARFSSKKWNIGNSSFSLCMMFMCHSAIVRELGKAFYNRIHCPAYHETAQTGLRNYKKKQYSFARR
ncbi:hypothetical protein TNCV_3256231 [Trichonephila clavipes]|nr:hypothetical protein TNCV_3256231 [Trichonephila clavipes]